MPDWQEIIDRDGKAVWQTAYGLLGHGDDADECVQEAFLDALGISRRSDVQQWRALLKRLVTARAIDCLRRRARRSLWLRLVGGSSVDTETSSACQAIEDRELSDPLRRALASLPRKQAEIFWLNVVEEMSYEEIAAQFSMTVNAVGVTMHRARTRLAKLLTSSGQGDADPSQAFARPSRLPKGPP